MKIVLANNKEITVKSVQANIDSGNFRPSIQIIYDPDTVSAASILADYKAGAYDEITAVVGTKTKEYNGYTYLVTIAERFNDYENSVFLSLSSEPVTTEDTDSDSGADNSSDSSNESDNSST